MSNRHKVHTLSAAHILKQLRHRQEDLSRAEDECSTDARAIVRAMSREVGRIIERLEQELPHVESEAVALVTHGATLSDASQWLEDATGGDAPATAA